MNGCFFDEVFAVLLELKPVQGLVKIDEVRSPPSCFHRFFDGFIKVTHSELPFRPSDAIFDQLRSKFLALVPDFILDVVVNQAGKVVTFENIPAIDFIRQVDVNGVFPPCFLQRHSQVVRKGVSLDVVNKLAVLSFHLFKLMYHRFFKVWVT